MTGRWEFWIDRGGTFTDVVGRRPDGAPGHAQAAVAQPRALPGRRRRRDPATAGPRPRRTGARRPGRPSSRWARPSPPTPCWSARASRTVLVDHQGLPRRAAHRLPEPAAASSTARSCCRSRSTSGSSRSGADRRARRGPPAPRPGRRRRGQLRRAHGDGFRSAAVVLLHGYRHPAHERAVGARGPRASASPRSAARTR